MLEELFGNAPTSLKISYLRISVGASDLDAEVFSYNDLPAGQTDVNLQKFNLSKDTVHLIPLLKEILAIRPDLRIMGSPWSAPVWMKSNGSSVGGNLNYFNDIYLDPNPDRRTAEAVDGLITDDPQWSKLLDQPKLQDGVTLDVFATKSWMYKRKYRIGLNASVSNVLDNQDFKVGGFEQLRYDRTDVGRFPPKYSYLFGRNYFAMVTFSF